MQNRSSSSILCCDLRIFLSDANRIDHHQALGNEPISVDDRGAPLAFTHIAAKLLGLPVGEPGLAGEVLFDDGAPEDEDVDPGVFAA